MGNSHAAHPRHARAASREYSLDLRECAASPLFAFCRLPWGAFEIAFTLTVGVFWYWIALNIERWSKRREVFLSARRHWRLLTDLLLVSDGVMLGLYAVTKDLAVTAIFRGMRGQDLLNRFEGFYFGWPWWIAFVFFHLGWSIVLIFFFGRDFVQCLSKKKLES